MALCPPPTTSAPSVDLTGVPAHHQAHTLRLRFSGDLIRLTTK
ncbi:unnamed protein product [Gulo gulo]|uniref:Uncharacterized protein n=1 Tax=Gulo gulo TaxID=48420 RepID=A0A9X9M2Q0_GULGU|nr:unnamed protein product [Gulo gulo]